MDQRAAQRAEIRKLIEKVQRAVAEGRIKFSPELDYRIRQQLERGPEERQR
jgi:hypothetical protein